jgi:DNA adenine methylase
MKIKSIAPWYGAKRKLAPTIVAQLGDHKSYWEPFCGSMAVLLSKPVSRLETVNDLHGDLINLARVTADPRLGPQFYRRARRMVVADDTLLEADGKTRGGDFEGTAPDLDRALAFFVGSWMGRNGEVGLGKNERAKTLCVRWAANGGDPATRFESAVRSIPAWRRRLRGVTILRRDAFDVLEKISDDTGTVIYCDPPYLLKSDRYLYDFNDGFMSQMNDHERLAAAVSRFTKARVIVSYYAHPALDQLYKGWTRVTATVTKFFSNQVGGPCTRKDAPEVLLINGPSFAAEAA